MVSAKEGIEKRRMRRVAKQRMVNLKKIDGRLSTLTRPTVFQNGRPWSRSFTNPDQDNVLPHL